MAAMSSQYKCIKKSNKTCSNRIRSLENLAVFDDFFSCRFGLLFFYTFPDLSIQCAKSIGNLVGRLFHFILKENSTTRSGDASIYGN